MDHKRRRRLRIAASVIEILIVVSILSSLLAILLPSVSAARERSRTLSCKNNLRTHAIATSTYEQAKRVLPPGSLGAGKYVSYLETTDPESPSFWKRFQHSGWAMHIAPFELWSSMPRHALNPNSSVYPDGIPLWECDGFRDASEVAPSEFKCPSDEFGSSSPSVYSALQPVFGPGLRAGNNVGIDWRELRSLSSARHEKTNYLAAIGMFSTQKQHPTTAFNGLFAVRHRRRIAEVKRGLSKCLAYGESIGEIRKGRRLAVQSYLLAGVGVGKSPGSVGSVFGNGDRASVVGFGSFHSSMTNVVFGDGHVESINDAVEETLFSKFFDIGLN